jgi:hypothetical protein
MTRISPAGLPLLLWRQASAFDSYSACNYGATRLQGEPLVAHATGKDCVQVNGTRTDQVVGSSIFVVDLRLNPVVAFDHIKAVAIVPRWVLSAPRMGLAAPFVANICACSKLEVYVRIHLAEKVLVFEVASIGDSK